MMKKMITLFFAIFLLSQSGSVFAIAITPTTSVITWSVPDDIVQGTALSAIQLNATCSTTTGTFIYDPEIGTILEAGTHELTCNFTPSDTRFYSAASSKVNITVLEDKEPMQLVFTTTADGQGIALPLYGTVDCTVDWGDESATEDFTTTGNKAHTFATAGTYTVSISGDLTQFGTYSAWTGVEYLTEVVSFGDVGLTSLYGAFINADNLTTVPSILPSSVTDLTFTFSEIDQASITNLDLWDVSNVTSMLGTFLQASAFNQNIGSWNTANVIDMSGIFSKASAFNQDISTKTINAEQADEYTAWDVSNVVSMSQMFLEAFEFNQAIGNWDVSNVTNMSNLFSSASAFNQDISTKTINDGLDEEYEAWDVSKVISMSRMFRNASVFNQDISSWDISNVTNMNLMFIDATAFDQNLGTWQIGAVTDMTDMFKDAALSTENYDALLTSWAAQMVQSGVTFGAGNTQYSAGAAATAHASLIADDNWTITDGGQAPVPMQLVFTTTADGQGIELPLYGTVNCTVDWGDESATEDFTTTGNKAHTFATAGTYTVEISGSLGQFGYYRGWGGAEYLSAVNSFGDIGLTSLSGAFCDADNLISVPTTLPATVTSLYATFMKIGQESITNLNNWDVSNVTNMQSLFSNATNFNQDISGWNVGQVTDMRYLFSEANKFNQDISRWDVANVTNMYYLFNQSYDFNQDISDWNVGNVTNMGGLFNGASSFNQDISNWNVEKAENMSEMFRDCYDFNQDISGWITTNVTLTYSMFAGASVFNQDISAWHVDNVTNMQTMFYQAFAFNQDISAWNVEKVTNMKMMFYVAKSFDQNLGSWDITSVTNMINMFYLVSLSTANYDAMLTSWAAQTVQSGVTFSGGNSQFSAGDAADARASLIADDNWTITDGGQAPVPMQLVFTTTADNQSIELPLYGTVDCTVDWGDGSATEDFTSAGDKAHTFATAGTYTVSISGDLMAFGEAESEESWTGVEYLTEVISFGDLGLEGLDNAFWNADNLTSVPAVLPTTVTSLFRTFSDIDQVSIVNLDLWDVSHVEDMRYMFRGSTLSTENYDALLISWAAQSMQIEVGFDGGNSIYSAGEAADARQSLINHYGWIITDGGQFKNTPVITWETPSAITYGTALSSSQLNASSSVDGAFAYSPDLASILSAGEQELTVIFTPTDAESYEIAYDTVSIMVNKATPTITWEDPESLVYGATLSATELDATCNVAGTFAYSPPAGIPLLPGEHSLSVVFTPTDASNYKEAEAEADLSVIQAELKATVKDASRAYKTENPEFEIEYAGFVNGDDASSLNRQPTITTDATIDSPVGTYDIIASNGLAECYNITYVKGTLTVEKATPVITWTNPSDINLGTALSATQLNASAEIPGTFVYTPAAGVVLERGLNQELTVIFTPDNTDDYAVAYDTVYINVDQATSITNAADATFQVYPNPASDGFYVSLAGAEDCPMMMTLIDASGRVVRSQALTSGAYLSAEDLSSGMYFVRLQADDKSVIKKIVIQ